MSSAHAQDQTTYTYDVHGRLTGVARPGSNTGYTYDNAQNRTHVTTTLVSGNHAPVANPDGPPAVAAGSSVTFDPRANDTDADSDSLTITGVSTNNTGKGAITYTTSSITYSANSGQGSGSDSFTYTISDGHGGTATGTVNITLNAACTVPIAGATSATVAYNSASNVIPLNISGGTPTSVAYVTGSSHGSVQAVGATMYYSPFSGYSGSDSFTYNATNACGTSNTATGTITVSPPANRNPVANPDSQSIAYNSYVYFDPRTNDSDPDGDPLTLVSVSTPAHGAAWTNSNNYLSYVPTDTGWSGYDYVYYTISDGRGGTATSYVQVYVGPTPVNHNPVANNNNGNPDNVSAGYTTSLTPLANDTDPDGDALTIQSIDSFYFAYGHIDGVDLNGSQAPADFGSVTNNGSYVSYRAPHLSAGSYMAVVFYYTVSDGHGGTSQAYEVMNVYGPG